MIMRITRDLGEIAAAHRLMDHGGACELLHGHNWAITVWVDAPVGATSGIAVDFLHFDALRRQLAELYDHGIWLNHRDPLAAQLESLGVPMKLTRVAGEPTAENMAALMLDHLVQAFPQGTQWGVRLGEMTGCTAEVSR